MNETVKERLNAFLRYKEVNNSEFGRAIGVSSAFVSSIRKSIQPDKIEKIKSTFPDLNVSWLLTGEGPMLVSDAKRGAGAVASSEERLTDENSFKYYFEMTATAGNIEGFTDSELGQEYKRVSFPGYEGCVAFNVSGESMLPTAKPKDIVVISPKPVETIVNGEIYLVVTKDGQRMIKRLRVLRKDEDLGAVIRCISDNRDQEVYAPFEIYGEDVHRIFRVKGFISDTHLG